MAPEETPACFTMSFRVSKSPQRADSSFLSLHASQSSSRVSGLRRWAQGLGDGLVLSYKLLEALGRKVRVFEPEFRDDPWVSRVLTPRLRHSEFGVVIGRIKDLFEAGISPRSRVGGKVFSAGKHQQSERKKLPNTTGPETNQVLLLSGYQYLAMISVT